MSVKVISPRRRFPRGVIAVSASLVPPGREYVENALTAEPLQSVQDQRYSRSNEVSSSMGAQQYREPYENPHRRIRRVATRMNPFPRASARFNPTSSTMEGTIGGRRMAGARFETITKDLPPSGISPREDRSIAEALKKRRYRMLPQTDVPGRSLDPDEFDDIFMQEQLYQSPQAAMLLSPDASPSGAKSQTPWEHAFDPSQTNTKRSPNVSHLPLPDSEGLKRDSPFRNEFRLQEDIGEQPLRLGGRPSTNKKSGGGLRLPARRTVVANDQEPPVRFVETRSRSLSMPTGVKRNQWSLGSVSTLSKKTQSSCDVRPVVTTSTSHPSYLREPKIGEAVTRCLPSSNDASSRVHHNPIRFFNNGEEVDVDGGLVQSTNNTVAVKQEQPPTPAKDCMRSRPMINQNPEDQPATNLQDCIRRPSASLSNKYDYPNAMTEYQASVWEMVTKEEISTNAELRGHIKNHVGETTTREALERALPKSHWNANQAFNARTVSSKPPPKLSPDDLVDIYS